MLALAYALLTLFVLIGIVAVIYMAVTLLMRQRGPGRFVVVLPSHVCEADIASRLCAARLRVGLMGGIAQSDIIALDCGMGEQVRLQCEALCQGLDHTMLLTPEEFMNELMKSNEVKPD